MSEVKKPSEDDEIAILRTAFKRPAFSEKDFPEFAGKVDKKLMKDANYFYIDFYGKDVPGIENDSEGTRCHPWRAQGES